MKNVFPKVGSKPRWTGLTVVPANLDLSATSPFARYDCGINKVKISDTWKTMVKSGDIVFYFRENEPISFPKSTPMETVAARIRDTIKEDSLFSSEVDLVDFGGVAEHFLGGRDDTPYAETPPLIQRP